MKLFRQSASKSRAGFTLIEIVLVLAIAGLILIAVFLAVSGAQKSRRDYQRKQFLGETAAAVEAFFADRRAHPDPQVVGSVLAFESFYLPKQSDPLTGKVYSSANSNFIYRAITAPHSDQPPVGTIYVQYGHWCNTPGRPDVDDPSDPIGGTDINPNNFVIWARMESGGTFCVDNYDK